jgi:hypothetical protein
LAILRRKGGATSPTPSQRGGGFPAIQWRREEAPLATPHGIPAATDSTPFIILLTNSYYPRPNYDDLTTEDNGIEASSVSIEDANNILNPGTESVPAGLQTSQPDIHASDRVYNII